MTPRERILAALHHERPDRTPTDGWFHPEVVEALKHHYNASDWAEVLRRLGIEGWADVGGWELFPHYAKRAVRRPGHSESFPAAWIDENTYEDPWGIRFKMGEGDRYQQWVSGPLENASSVDEIARYPFPEPADIRELDGRATQVAKLKAENQFVCGGIENPFKRLWHLRGYENALMDYASDPDLVNAIYDPLFALSSELAVRMTRAGVDMIKVVGDVAMQDRVIMKPELWRRIDKPRWAKFISTCRAINKDLFFFFHSDGKLTDLMDDLIEVGFNVINPIQPECMDPFEVKKWWGKRITLHGCISLQRTLPFGSVADVRAEVEGLIRGCGQDGGLVLMPSNVIQPDTPIQNIVACYEAARDLKWS